MNSFIPDSNPIEHLVKTNKAFEKAVRTNAVPPIKGEITKGKLRWRGIYRVMCPKTNEDYLMQRGKQISETLKLFAPIPPMKMPYQRFYIFT